jgi:DNA repair protein RecO (recombination protein O)
MELRGVVIHSTSFEESSRVIELLTASEGKLGCVARGARASKRRFPGGLELFSTLDAEVTPARSLWRLESATVVRPRLGLRRALDRFERAGRLTECARALANAHQQSDAQLAALEDGLDACDRGDLAAASTAYPRLLTAAGIMPDRASLRCAPATAEALLSGTIGSVAIADDVERVTLAWIEQHTGHVLKTRVTPIT